MGEGRVDKLRSAFEVPQPSTKPVAPRAAPKPEWEATLASLFEREPSTKEMESINAKLINLSAEDTGRAVTAVAKKIAEIAPRPEEASKVLRLTEALTVLTRHQQHFQKSPPKAESWRETPSGTLFRTHSAAPLSQKRAAEFERAYDALMKEPPSNERDAKIKLLELERLIDLAQETKDAKRLQDMRARFEVTLNEYEGLITDIPGDAARLKAERYSLGEMRLPGQLRSEMFRAVQGFHPGADFPLALASAPNQMKMILSDGVAEFIKLAKERPEEAQHLAKEMALVAASVSDDKQFREFSDALDGMNRRIKEMPATAAPAVSEKGLAVYERIQIVKRMQEMASLEGNEGKLARGALADLNIDPQAKGFELFESPLDRTPLEVRLHQVRNPLLGIAATQADKALGKNPEYQNLALEGIRRSVVANVEDRRRQEVGEGKLKAKDEKSRWFHFSASKAKGYLKQMWEADTWKERFTRTAVAGAAGALGVGLIGGGVGLLFVPYAGPLIGATVMGLSSSVPELYVRVNEGVDALFQKPEESLEAQMRGRMSKSIVDDLRKRNVIPRYREVYKEQLPRSEQRKADDLVRLLRADLDRGYARSGDLQKTIEHYNKVVASTFVSTTESDDWVHAAHSEVIADWLMPELDYCINGMGNWSSAPLVMPEEEMRKAFLQRTRLAA